jgi:hypothetical protein
VGHDQPRKALRSAAGDRKQTSGLPEQVERAARGVLGDLSLVKRFQYVEELDRLSHAGLSAAAVLRAATRTAAESLGNSAHAGFVAEGMDADLVLVEHDPLASVRNVAHPAGVMLHGNWMPRADLDQRIREYRPAP